MNFSTVEASISEISEQLDEITVRRERLIKESREVLALSAKSIVDVHTSNLDLSKVERDKDGEKFDILRNVAGTDNTRYLMMPEQEYVE